ncbi:hypothetical protein JIG36_05395 [Actinoplanes sp. LDG1-06]|uniref:Uncharacterized protein n=1 Tax=Paractinoplanes ovalisporus TaxID=2810368 RepID=A0ABS2A579_9ACTN|nr:hypothetical protein [Actinoplanes ovalisporus]MBM2614992.1 hypothetical protein [Actinoplanes ovalisporus]
MNSDAEVEAQVRENLRPGETFRAAVWASRADGRTLADLTKADLSPWRFRRPSSAVPENRRGLHGRPRSRAVAMDEHIRIVTDPRLLAVTDQRLMVLAKRRGGWRDVFRSSTGEATALSVRWECPREEVASATEQDGRLRLDFTDGSAVTLLTPSAESRPFLAALS